MQRANGGRVKRSDLNAIIADATRLIEQRGLFLPPFAHWTPQEFRDRANDVQAIVEANLGWDVTDFGQGRFDHLGAVLFTLRNGSLSELAAGGGRVYAEKLLLLRDGQRTPLHCHLLKTEDLINRGGGVLALRLCGSGTDGAPDPDRGVTVDCDGIARWVAPDTTLRLEPGESVALRPGDWHQIRAEGGTCLIGEIASVNDDLNDNLFSVPCRRFPEIEDDCTADRLLVCDYPAFFR